jgi:hypothetical protein
MRTATMNLAAAAKDVAVRLWLPIGSTVLDCLITLLYRRE